jgi:hypothetical protein
LSLSSTNADMERQRAQPRTASINDIRVWGKPLILAATTLAGLLLALFENGIADLAFTGLLALPIIA